MELNKRISRVLLENKAQYIGSIVLIIFSCLAFTLMTHFAFNFERLANEFEDEARQEDAAFTTDKRITNLQELESEADAVIEEGLTLDYRLSEGETLRVFSRNNRVNLPGILEGEALSESGDLLLSPGFATANNYELGDQLKILDQSFTVTGFMALPNYMYPLQSELDTMPQPGFGVAVISKEDFAALGKGSRFYAVKFNQAAEDRRDQSAQFRALLDSRGIEVVEWTDIEDNKRVNIVHAEVEILGLVSKGVPTAIFLLASIMVGNVIWRLINRESAIIGSLCTLGYRRSEIYRHYLTLPLLVAVVGGIIGTVVGVFPIRFMVEFMLSVFNMPLTGIELNPMLLLMSLLLPVLFLGASGYFVIRKELKHSPVELMRGKEESSRVNFLERALRLEKLQFPTKFKIREQLRSLSRLGFLLIGIAVATMLLQWGFSLKSSVDYLFGEGNLASIFNFEYEYKFNRPRNEPLPEGVEPFSAELFLPREADQRDFYVIGVKPDSAMLALLDESGTRLSTDQVIITQPVVRILNVKPGDTASIIRKLDGRRFSIGIDAVADTWAGKFVYMPLADFNEKFGLPAGSYTGAFGNVLLDLPEDESYSVISVEEKVAGARELMGTVQPLIGFLATVAFIIGIIVIYVVTTMLVEENRTTISLMKIFGYRRNEVNSLVLNSSTIVVVVGYLIGIPLTLAAIGVLIQSIETSVGLMVPPMKIGPLYVLIGFVVVMLAYELSKWFCRRKVDAVSMSEALKAGLE